ncbi:MAG: hypothetical protein MI757_07835 [Pirellulales bacterium]|nr:hypothetical protein [Pirellulales bacterium]
MAKKPSNAVEANNAPVERRASSDRRQGDRRQNQQPVATERRSTERRKVQRRRQIDPTTCERDYSADEIEFMHAIDHFKRTTGQSFPGCQDVLEVIKKLGYRKV